MTSVKIKRGISNRFTVVGESAVSRKQHAFYSGSWVLRWIGGKEVQT
jgi:hypothetical protein